MAQPAATSLAKCTCNRTRLRPMAATSAAARARPGLCQGSGRQPPHQITGRAVDRHRGRGMAAGKAPADNRRVTVLEIRPQPLEAMLEQPIQRAAQSSGDGAEQRQAPVSAPQQPQHRQHAAQRQQISVAQEREPGQQPEKGVRHGAAQRVRQGAIESHHGAGPPHGHGQRQEHQQRKARTAGAQQDAAARLDRQHTRATPRASSAARQGSRRNNSKAWSAAQAALASIM